MPIIELPNGEEMEVPDDITPEIGRRLRAYIDSLRKPSAAQPTRQAGDARPLSPAAQRMEESVAAARKENRPIAGLAEAGLSALSGLASSAVGGVAGLGRTGYALATGDSFDEATAKGAETISKTQEMGTYKPRTEMGKALTGISEVAGSVPTEISKAVGGAVGQAAGGAKGRMAGEAIGEALPAVTVLGGGLAKTARNAMQPKESAGMSSRGAKLLDAAMRDFSPEDLKQAAQVMEMAAANKIPLTGPEAFKIAPKLHDLATKVDGSNNIIARFLKERPDAAKAAISEKLKTVGEDVGLQKAADQIQEAADTDLTNVQKNRTEMSSPDYSYQRKSDAEALSLMDQVEGLQKSIDDGTAWKNDAVQQAGRWYSFTNDMRNKSNKLTPKQQELKPGDPVDIEMWKSEILKDHPNAKFTKEDGSGKTYGEEGDWTAHTGPDMQADVVGVFTPEFASVMGKGRKASEIDREYGIKSVEGEAAWEAEGGRVPENKKEVFDDRVAEGKSATVDAVNEARRRQDFIDGWKQEVDQKADKLAEKNLGVIEDRVRGFISKLNQNIRLVNKDTVEGKILQQFRDELAPNGTPLMLPSQLESVYKTNRDKLALGLQPTAADRTTAGVLKGSVSELDDLIQEVSPAIKQGREIYAQMSKDIVDPLMKGPVGRVAGKGADAQKEVAINRVYQELEGKTAHPDRIRLLADRITKVDPKAFPNVVRTWLESKFDKSSEVKIGQNDRLVGAKFAQAIASTPKERANISTMIEKVAEAQGGTKKQARQAARGFGEMLDVLEATGRIPKLGTRGLDESSVLDKMSPAAAIHHRSYGAAKGLMDAVKEVLNKKAYAELARVFTDADSIEKMQKLAGLSKLRKTEREQLVKDILVRSVEAEAALVMAPSEKE